MLIARGDDVDRIVGPEPGAAAFGVSIWLPTHLQATHPSAICLTECAIRAYGLSS